MELELFKVTKEFQDMKAVNEVSYSFGNGVYGLLGVNGAGKTTLMRMLCTLLQPSSGNITWDGEDIFAMDGRYRNILGYLPQDFGYYPDFTVYDYLLYIASIKGLRQTAARKRADALLRQVGLEKVQNKKMKKLSGGMKRRAGIAQALLNDPRILILDEPTAGLDPNERIRFRNLISELSQERVVLLSTHIVSDIEYIANEILMMQDGSIVRSGSAEELVCSMQEKVWNLEVERGQVEHYLKAYKVANVRIVGKDVELRILSAEKPAEYANPEKASLEDVFLYYVNCSEPGYEPWERAGGIEDDEI